MSWFFAFVRATGGPFEAFAGSAAGTSTAEAVSAFSQAPVAQTFSGLNVEDYLLMEWEETMLRDEAQRYAAAVKPLGRASETKQEFASALHDAARPLARLVHRRNARTVQRVDEIVSEALANEGIDPEGNLGLFARGRVRWMLSMRYGAVSNMMKAA